MRKPNCKIMCKAGATNKISTFLLFLCTADVTKNKRGLFLTGTKFNWLISNSFSVTKLDLTFMSELTFSRVPVQKWAFCFFHCLQNKQKQTLSALEDNNYFCSVITFDSSSVTWLGSDLSLNFADILNWVLNFISLDDFYSIS